MDEITLLLLLIFGGIILLFLLIIPTKSELNKLQNTIIREGGNENTQGKNNFEIQAKYSVIYKSGPLEIDQTARKAKKDSGIFGIIKLSSDGLHFVGSQKNPQQKFFLQWDQINYCVRKKTSIILGEKYLHLHTTKYGLITFVTSQADAIEADVSRYISSSTQMQDRDNYYEYGLIKTRNLDLLSVKIFRKTIARLFVEMGYFVSNVDSDQEEYFDYLLISDIHRTQIVLLSRNEAEVGISIVNDFEKAMKFFGARTGYIITTGEFNKAAQKRSKIKGIKTINGRQLVELLDKYNI